MRVNPQLLLEHHGAAVPWQEDPQPAQPRPSTGRGVDHYPGVPDQQWDPAPATWQWGHCFHLPLPVNITTLPSYHCQGHIRYSYRLVSELPKTQYWHEHQHCSQSQFRHSTGNSGHWCWYICPRDSCPWTTLSKGHLSKKTFVQGVSSEN